MGNAHAHVFEVALLWRGELLRLDYLPEAKLPAAWGVDRPAVAWPTRVGDSVEVGGDVRWRITRTLAEPAPARSTIDGAPLGWALFSVVLHALAFGTFALSHMATTDDAETRRANLAWLHDELQASDDRAVEGPSEGAATSAEEFEAESSARAEAQASGEEGTHARASLARLASSSSQPTRADLLREASEFGMIGLLKAHAVADASTSWAGEASPGATYLADTSGGSLGLTGTGEGGGGFGEGIDIGEGTVTEVVVVATGAGTVGWAPPTTFTGRQPCGVGRSTRTARALAWSP